MPPKFCPECGTRVTEDNPSFCEECGAKFEQSTKEDADAFGVTDSIERDSSNSGETALKASSLLTGLASQEIERTAPKVFSTLIAIIAGLVAAFGGFGLWIWALALIHENWGMFWLIIGIVTVILPVVVIVMCFAWGVPQFFLAFLTWSFATIALSAEGSKRTATVGFVGMLAFGGATGYVAWSRAHSPKAITAREREQLTDDALALIILLRTPSTTNDAAVAIDNTRIKTQLRHDMAGYDAARKDVIAKIVADYLAYQKSSESDILNAFERRANGYGSVASLSPRTRGALAALPEKIQQVLAADEEELRDLNKIGDSNFHDMPPDWRERVTSALANQAKTRAVVYQDVMGRSMP